MRSHSGNSNRHSLSKIFGVAGTCHGHRRKSWRVFARISSKLNLHDFPIDLQTLVIAIKVPRVDHQGISKVVSEYFKQNRLKHYIEIDNAWKVCSHKSSVEIICPRRENFRPEYRITVIVQRKSHYYIFNVAAPNAMLALLNFGVFFLGTNNLVDRMSVILAVLLTGVTFKLAVSGLLPVVSYETALENYSNALVAIVYISGFVSVIVCMLPGMLSTYINFCIGAGLFSAYTYLHIYYFNWYQSKISEGLQLEINWGKRFLLSYLLTYLLTYLFN